jgi:hypothetical protein
MQKYKKLVESIRLFGMIAIATLMIIGWLNLISGLMLAVLCGLIDQVVVTRYLKPKDEK